MSEAHCACYKNGISDLALGKREKGGKAGQGGQEKEENRADVQGNN